MNNERPIDILDAIINKKLYKSVYTKQADDLEYQTPVSPATSSAFLASMGILPSNRPSPSVVPDTVSNNGSSSVGPTAESAPTVSPTEVSVAGTSDARVPAEGARRVSAPATPAPVSSPAPAAAPAAGAVGAREIEENSPWKEASFFAGVGNDKFAVFNTRDNVEATLQKIGINPGGHRINIEPGKAALLELNNGARVVVYSDVNGNKQLIISDPERLGARVPGNNLQALPPAMYSLVYRNYSNDNNASLGATQGVQSYDPTQLVQQLLAALIQAINASGSNNNALGNNWANSILSNIPITPILGS